ncbi:MAG: ABC transporter substrate-binding protein [Pseudomonadota bacterium]
MRIVSLLPSATDIVVELGAGGELVGVSHSCSGDWDHLPKLTSTWIDTGASAAEIDRQVKTASQPLYQLDIEILERLAPNVVISQSLCDVCAVPSGDVREAVVTLSSRPTLVDLSPNRLIDVPVCFDQVGAAIGRQSEARALRERWDATLDSYRGRHAASGSRVAFLDWLDPPFIAGHWIPDMVEHLGLTVVLGKAGKPSFETSWEAIAAARPDLVIAACCGFDASRAQRNQVPIDCPVVHLDGHLHFSRPSPALLPSLAMLSDTIAEFMELA